MVAFISFGFDCVDVDVDFGELASAVVVVSRIPALSVFAEWMYRIVSGLYVLIEKMV